MGSLYWKMIREIPRAFWTSAGVTTRVICIIGLVVALAAVLGFTQYSVDRWPSLNMAQTLLVLFVVFSIAVIRLFHLKLSELLLRLHDALTELDSLKESKCDMAESARAVLHAIESDARNIAATVPSRSLEISGLEDVMKRLRGVLNQRDL